MFHLHIFFVEKIQRTSGVGQKSKMLANMFVKRIRHRKRSIHRHIQRDIPGKYTCICTYRIVAMIQRAASYFASCLCVCLCVCVCGVCACVCACVFVCDVCICVLCVCV